MICIANCRFIVWWFFKMFFVVVMFFVNIREFFNLNFFKIDYFIIIEVIDIRGNLFFIGKFL